MDERHEQIESYLSGDMNADGRRAFEERMKSDPALAQEVELYRSIEMDLGSKVKNEVQENELKLNLTELGEQHFTAAPKKQTATVRWIAFAAAAAAIALLLLWSPWQNSLYDTYANHPQAAFTTKGDSNIEQAAEAAFNAHNYKQALPLLEQLTTVQPEDISYQFYKGIALLETGKTSEAGNVFKQIEAGRSLYREAAQWYLALTYLKDEQHEKCRAQLLRIEVGSEYYNRARGLLNEL